jgi:hypothetical protein
VTLLVADDRFAPEARMASAPAVASAPAAAVHVPDRIPARTALSEHRGHGTGRNRPLPGRPAPEAFGLIQDPTQYMALCRAQIERPEDLISGVVSFNGGVAKVIRPGEGIVIQDTGRIVFDADFNVVFVAGPHDQNDLGPAQAYCSALP